MYALDKQKPQQQCRANRSRAAGKRRRDMTLCVRTHWLRERTRMSQCRSVWYAMACREQ